MTIGRGVGRRYNRPPLARSPRMTTAYDFTAQDIDGHPVPLSGYAG